jgi:hypothetical protein
MTAWDKPEQGEHIMTRTATTLATLITALAFTGMIATPAVTYAVTAGTAPVEIKVRVSEKGFLDEKGKAYNTKNMLKIPTGTLVTLTFVFSEDMTSLAVGDTHQIVIQSDDHWKEETDKLWIMNRQASITFRVGENGRTQYRAYCMLDCIGMEHLTNLLIQVV